MHSPPPPRYVPSSVLLGFYRYTPARVYKSPASEEVGHPFPLPSLPVAQLVLTAFHQEASLSSLPCPPVRVLSYEAVCSDVPPWVFH